MGQPSLEATEGGPLPPLGVWSSSSSSGPPFRVHDWMHAIHRSIFVGRWVFFFFLLRSASPLTFTLRSLRRGLATLTGYSIQVVAGAKDTLGAILARGGRKRRALQHWDHLRCTFAAWPGKMVYLVSKKHETFFLTASELLSSLSVTHQDRPTSTTWAVNTSPGHPRSTSS